MMKLKKYEQQIQIKTLNSQQSGIDMFSKIEGHFLEKFFRYNISDYFGEMIANVYQDVLEKKVYSKAGKCLSNQLFLVNSQFVVQEFQQKIQNFYRNRSKSIQLGELPYAFRFKYSNMVPTPNLIKQGQLILIEVRIKAQVEKIQDLPQLAITQLQSYKKTNNHKLHDANLDNILQNYNQEYFNLFICYYGDTNFHIFNKHKYQVFEVTILNHTHKLRIFVFYISRQAMIETFKTVNKIGNLQYINDLVIQFYEIKRQKSRSKKQKHAKILKQKNANNLQISMIKVTGVLSLIAAGVFLIKIVI